MPKVPPDKMGNEKSVGTPAVPEAHVRVKRAFLVHFIAERVREKSDTPDEARNKVRLRLDYAIKNGKLPSPINDTLVFGDVVRWARSTKLWRDKLAGLPESPPEAPLPVRRRVLSEFESAHDLTDLDCETLLAQACERINDLESQLRDARAENDRLRPSAERYEHIRRRNRESGAKGGRPRRGRSG
jgi:hypothetical protein